MPDAAQHVLGYLFRDAQLLREALTHASSADHRLKSNERLEFLGDAILGYVVCEELYRAYPNLLEGDLTKIKSAVVSRRVCAKVTRSIRLEELLNLGKGMTSRPGLPPSVAAAVFESIIAAIYLDGGMDAARDFILRHLRPYIEDAANSEHQQNFKSVLQQLTQQCLEHPDDLRAAGRQGTRPRQGLSGLRRDRRPAFRRGLGQQQEAGRAGRGPRRVARAGPGGRSPRRRGPSGGRPRARRDRGPSGRAAPARSPGPETGPKLRADCLPAAQLCCATLWRNFFAPGGERWPRVRAVTLPPRGLEGPHPTDPNRGTARLHARRPVSTFRGLPQPETTAMPTASDPQHVHWGILGAGGIAKAFTSGIAHSSVARVTAVGSRDQARADAFVRDNGMPDATAHGSYEALLADDHVDAIYIATPHPHHAEWAVRAARAGKHLHGGKTHRHEPRRNHGHRGRGRAERRVS